MALLIAFAALLLWRNSAPPGSPRDERTAKTPVGAVEPAATAAAGPAAESTDHRATLERHAYAQAWADAAQPAAMAAFRAWTDRYRTAPPAARSTLLPEGVALA
ncbi:MAG: hypothetical protein ABIQ12_10635, partial [Opitutaceae bacterium]